MRRPSWHLLAACSSSSSSSEVFFPDRGHDASEARVICESCTVRCECLSFANGESDGIPVQVYGVWGGQTVRERLGTVRERLGTVCERLGTTFAIPYYDPPLAAVDSVAPQDR